MTTGSPREEEGRGGRGEGRGEGSCEKRGKHHVRVSVDDVLSVDVGLNVDVGLSVDVILFVLLTFCSHLRDPS